MDPAAPDLTYQWERFGLIAKEFPVLFKQHWKEIALNQDKVPLDPDWQRYYDMDMADVLNVLTVRSNKVLVGYVFVLISQHLHYFSTRMAVLDIFWLDPAYRAGWAGVRMFREVEKHLKTREVKVMHAPVKLHFEAERGTIGVIFKRLGYRPIETMYAKVIN